MTSVDPQEMIERAIAGELTEAESEVFTAWLKADREHQRRYLREVMFQSDLAREVKAREERRALGYQTERLPAARPGRAVSPGGPKRPRTRAVLALSMALAACLLAGLGLWMEAQQQPAPTPAVATLVSADGAVSIRRSTATIPGSAGADLAADDQVMLSGAGTAEIAFADGTTVSVGSGTTLGLVGDQRQKRLYLVGGSATVRATKQSDDRPLLLATAHVELTVVGTVFTVTADSGATRLQVSDGVVSLHDRSTNERYRVGSGQQLAAGPEVARPPVRTAAMADPRIGVELSTLGDNGPELAFVDVFRQAAPWRAAGAGGALTLDADGWIARLSPGQTAETVMCRGLSGRYPKGTYVCLYDGAGELTAAGDATIVARAPGRLELSVDPGDQGIVLRLTETSAADPLRRIRVIMPGHEATYREKPFHPDFLARWNGAAVIHAGSWAEYRAGAQPYTWDERVRPDCGPRPAERGRPLEELFALAETLRSDVWLRIPHQADDGYCLHAAQLAQRFLRPGQRLYLELGRDLWDTAWEPGQYAEAQGRAAGHTEMAAVRWYVDRSLAVFDRFRSVFGEDPRLVRVLSGNASNAWVNRALLSWNHASQHIDALAVLAGAGGSIGDGMTGDDFLAMDRAQVMDVLRTRLTGIEALAGSLVAETRAAGIRLLTVRTGLQLYVGALQGPVTWRHHVHAASFANEPEVRSILGEWLTVWSRTTGDLICASPSMEALRSVDAPPGTLPSASGVMSYQAIAPFLRRRAVTP